MSEDIDLATMMVEVIEHEDHVTVLLGIGRSCVTVTWDPLEMAADDRAAAALMAIVGNLPKVMSHVVRKVNGDGELGGSLLDLRAGMGREA